MVLSGKYSWEESQTDITIFIPFKGSLSKVNIFITDCMLKVSYPPFLLDIDLNDTVRTKSCSAVMKDKFLLINIEKVTPILWYELSFKGTKKEAKKRREDSIRRREKEIQEQHENARSMRLEEERLSVRMQMALDQREYQHIEDLKNNEKKDAEDELYSSIESWTKEITTKTLEMTTFVDDCEAKSNEDENENTTFDSYSICFPSIRDISYVKFKHTPRAFKTPIRESTLLKETEFLVKNRPYISNNKYFNKTTDITETDSLWMKKKGDDFFCNGDYVSAINAFSEAYEKNDQLIQALTNRSLCYLHLGEMKRCIRDGEDAIQMLQKKTFGSSLSISETKSLHKKVLIRIATAYSHIDVGNISNHETALNYLEKATMLDKTDELLTRDISRLKVIIKAMTLKTQGDQYLAGGQIEAAIKSYRNAILKEKTLICAMVNCATAYLLMGETTKCISLCSDALDMLKMLGPSKINNLQPIGTIPMPGTNLRKNFTIATLSKRAEAYIVEHELDHALADMKMIHIISKFLDDEVNIQIDIDNIKIKKGGAQRNKNIQQK